MTNVVISFVCVCVCVCGGLYLHVCLFCTCMRVLHTVRVHPVFEKQHNSPLLFFCVSLRLKKKSGVGRNLFREAFCTTLKTSSVLSWHTRGQLAASAVPRCADKPASRRCYADTGSATLTPPRAFACLITALVAC